ncbi:FKBP-type peptidyl-prolyl cis-trans isomerase [Trueperella abortisuis]|uniref:peptidylprolyl isomerase n=1 Tax=Trueperella abortisuis TaxID=445930 RepID=A0ABT9PHV7_9ACTO|nr:FKBP-type peptidyl-prolyl cis-trans isomerase [Trueperella abortisuis]MDP9832278.1 peptidylprolyl isomerase [Trueperella abortisuis]
MRVLASVIALALAFGVTACGSDDPKQPASSQETTSASGTPGTQMPTLDSSGDNPILAFPDSNAPEGLQVEVLEKGEGRQIAATDTVVANYVGQVWGSSRPFDSSFNRGAPTAFSLSMVIKGWTQGLTGQTAGSKLIVSVPSDLGYGPNGGNESAGIGESDTIAFYIELIDAYGVDQAGDANATMQADLADLPIEIKGALGEPVTVTVKDGAKKPTGEPVVTVIARGSGAPVGGKGTTIYDQYAMSFWDNSTSENTYGSYGPQSQTLGAGSFFDSLTGIPVGSRVLVEVPASEGGEGVTAPAYAVVIDILGQIEGSPNATVKPN